MEIHVSAVVTAVTTVTDTLNDNSTNSLVRYCRSLPTQINYSTYKYENGTTVKQKNVCFPGADPGNKQLKFAVFATCITIYTPAINFINNNAVVILTIKAKFTLPCII